ncbi:glycosyltransferase 61 family protein [Nocardioides sp. 616]|uniref:glycosyltransferase family 61 protein n=1 Tax=Nocardioides sp. 616 TaxID=2268090 RepID=UPI0013B3A7CB|nr:glycosyltransferase 61 family protein [Nocardioides sp. 616]
MAALALRAPRLRHRSEWRAAVQPVRPRRTPHVEEVADAYLSRVATGELATVHRPNKWFSGAVYTSAGELVPASQKILGDPRGLRVAADPSFLPPVADVRLDGTWLYGGTWAPTFGHFLVETLTTLWPRLPQQPSGLVFHSSFGPTNVEGWHRRLLALAGFADLSVHVVGTGGPVVVEHLVVPSRSVALQAWVHPEARSVWDTIASPFRGAGQQRVYVSRTMLNEHRRAVRYRREVRSSAEHDRALDEVFAARGFDILCPETLDIGEQLERVASAEVIAGLSGSGLHHSAFIPRGGRVVELGDGRNATRPVRMQCAIDAASGHQRRFIRGDAAPGEVNHILGRLGLT